ncbi:hypothetical protein [Prosthecobacter sp.]|uniref:hypothetical protein n=1 Tax=Prosthecobacter sp. TaxID=1965333 RepID=UPI003904A144
MRAAVAAGMGLLAACSVSRLKPAWQQDPNLYQHGVPARPSQTATTPHLVARVIYAAPDQIVRLVERQGDVPDTQRGFARMGDGTLELALQDVATGKWLESHLCGGILFVAGLPHQAYRIVLKNRTPMPLELGLSVDGKDAQTGAAASLRRGGLRLEPHGTLMLEQASYGPLLFKAVSGDAALFDTRPRGRTGVIQIAVFLAADAPSIGPEKLKANQIAPLGFFPLGAPERYR